MKDSGLHYLSQVRLGTLHTCREHIWLWLSAFIKLGISPSIPAPISLATIRRANDVMGLQLLGHRSPQLGVTQRRLYGVDLLIASELSERLI